MNTCCTVVIGHVDHGKTTLVRALTGMETDRLPEEKARGLSIVPGFAHCSYPSGSMDFVDAPGHEDFVHAMICGAAGAEAALIVVAADEGIAAQTLEHLRIAELLGITKAVIAVTKSDLVSPAKQMAGLREIEAQFAETGFAAAPKILCSALTGDGMDALHSALSDMLQAPCGLPSPLGSVLAVDRVFSVTGRGTVVTGTLLGRDLTLEDRLTLYPAGRSVQLRGLQCRSADLVTASSGTRVAANLRGLAVEDIKRGDVLGTHLSPSCCMDVRLTILPRVKRLKHLQEVRVLFGTTSVTAQIRLFREPDGREPQFGQLRFRKTVCGYAGQRGILRRLSPPETLGGVEILDPDATPTRAGDADRAQILRVCQTDDPDQIAQALVLEQGGAAALADIARLARLRLPDLQKALGNTFLVMDDGLVGRQQDIDSAKQHIVKHLTQYHETYPLHTGMPRLGIPRQSQARAVQDRAISDLVATGTVRSMGETIALVDHDPVKRLTADQCQRMTEIEEIYRAADLSPLPQTAFSDTALDQALIDLMLGIGRLVSLRNVSLNQTITLHSASLSLAAQRLRTHFAPPESFTTGAARDVLGTSRKVIVPLLEHFDATGVSVRKGDTRHLKL